MRINRTWFGGVEIDGKKYRDVLIIEGKIIDRGKWGYFDTHTISERELNELLKGDPEIILIGSGQSGVLEVPEEVKMEIRKRNIELIVLETPKAIEKFNEIYEKKKKVNALIHTTC
ncbi:MAG: MTH938/NDUFAF3 family protein [Candidatus Aenigmatarchaeota archaeon]